MFIISDSSDDCIEITSEDVPKSKDVNVKAKTAPLGCQTSRQKLKNSKPRIISKVSPLKSPPRETSESGTLILVNNSPNTVTQSDCANELTPIESTSNTDCQSQPNVPEKKSTRSPRKQTLVVRKEAQEKQVNIKVMFNKMLIVLMLCTLFIHIEYYSHFIGHLLSRYRRISDCLYSIVYGQAGRYAP